MQHFVGEDGEMTENTVLTLNLQLYIYLSLCSSLNAVFPCEQLLWQGWESQKAAWLWMDHERFSVIMLSTSLGILLVGNLSRSQMSAFPGWDSHNYSEREKGRGFCRITGTDT